MRVRQAHPFNLEVVNIQDKGQEQWKKKYVYWIPVLHVEGQEVAKGRWDGETVIQALNEWEKEKTVAKETGGENANMKKSI